MIKTKNIKRFIDYIYMAQKNTNVNASESLDLDIKEWSWERLIDGCKILKIQGRSKLRKKDDMIKAILKARESSPISSNVSSRLDGMEVSLESNQSLQERIKKMEDRIRVLEEENKSLKKDNEFLEGRVEDFESEEADMKDGP